MSPYKPLGVAALLRAWARRGEHLGQCACALDRVQKRPYVIHVDVLEDTRLDSASRHVNPKSNIELPR